MQSHEKIAFLDLEISVTSRKIQDIGILLDELEYEQINIEQLKEIFIFKKPNFICGHNFINFDKSYLGNSSFNMFMQNMPIIDTLYISLLLFPDKSTHKLEKPYKQEIHRENPQNSPLQDCKNTKNLFIYLNEHFEKLPQNLQDIFIFLLKDNEFFKGFFLYKQQIPTSQKSLFALLGDEFGFEKELFENFLNTPLEFALVLSFIHMLKTKEARYFSPFILTNYPQCVGILKVLQNAEKIDIDNFAKDEFKINSFRSFQRQQSPSLLNSLMQKSNTISQKDIIQSALNEESFLAILPTGGGKTFTFQLPALIKARQYKSLTIVISPLQALMQNHIESFKLKNQNFCIEAISGFLNPIERFSVFDKLINGEVDILYLAPEALRSNAIFKALQKRYIERFVIDEAHCFSMWGHNFRQDYHFIAQTIKDLEQSPHQSKIAISCFTATAKPEVIADIKRYFSENLGSNLKEFIASSERKSLSYEVLQVASEAEKKEKLWQILLQREQEKPKEMKNPTIIYIPQNAGLCKKLWLWLKEKFDKFNLNLSVEPFYAKLDDDVSEGRKDGRKKAEILQAFMDDDVDIIIATTAFGMGIDKPNITTIIHYQLSDSLESYIQESGRGARDEEKYKAKCFILYDKKDIDKNFAQLRQSNLDFGEIQSLVRVLKNEYKGQKRNPIYISLKNLHKKLGKDEVESEEFKTPIKTALLELEKAEFIQRKRYKTQIYATSLKLKEGKDKMNLVHQTLDSQKEAIQAKSEYKRNFDEKVFLKLYEVMILIVQNIIQRSRENTIVSLDELSDIVGSIEETQMVQALKILENNGLLAKENDIFIFVDSQKARRKMQEFFNFERDFFEHIKDDIQRGKAVDLRKFNDKKLKNLATSSIKQNPLYILKFIIKSWGQLLRLAQIPFKCHFKNEQCFFAASNDVGKLYKAIILRKDIALFVIDKIVEKIAKEHPKDKLKGVEIDISSSKIYDLLQEKKLKSTLSGFHLVLNMMNEILDKDFDIRAGRLIYHQKECIEFKLDKINEKAPYKKENYDNSFKIYMQSKIANIHILQAFLDNFINKGENFALAFMKNYFSLDKKTFLKEYKINETFIKSPISRDLLDNIILDLNEVQRKILDDESKAIMILAGPGSGKTKTLVNKMAYLLTKEDKKSENLLMLAHSRVAVLEFRSRLYKLLGEGALGVKIPTFHSFALSLLGIKVQDDKELEDKIEQATRALMENEITLPYIEMLVLDEYQDVNLQSYEFIKAIYEKMSGEKQIIAVGDDDQLIMKFNKNKQLNADKKFIQHFGKDFGVQDGKISFSTHTLGVNYRSASKIVYFTNAYRREFLVDSLKTDDLKANPQNQKEGFISFTQHKFTLSLRAMASEIQRVGTDENKSIAVLLRNNNEVLQIRYELENLGIKAKYILNHEGFRAGNLIELWEFLECLKNGLNKNEAYAKICEKYKNSQNLIIFEDALRHFVKEYHNDLSYIENAGGSLGHNVLVADFELFLKEFDFDELKNFKNQVIVSTIHKAKGKEFDFVFVGFDGNFNLHRGDESRLAYVAFTRAKQKLFIHSQKSDLLILKEHFNEFKIYDKKDEAPPTISYIMGLNDIYLDKTNIKNLKTNIVAGDECMLKIQNHADIKVIDILWENKSIASLSNKFVSLLFEKIKQGYTLLEKTKVQYVVKWYNKKKDEMTTQILCEICLVR